MTFSLSSLLFLTVVTLFFFGARREARPYVLLAASLWFIWRLDARSCLALFACTGLVWLAGLLTAFLLRRQRQRLARAAASVSVILLIAALLLFKYAARFLPLLPLSASAGETFALRFLLPIGFSYYVFQAIDYLAGIASGRADAEKNPFLFALYMCFFPKFVSGPIERAHTFLPQLETLAEVRFFDPARLSGAVSWILYGWFLKTVAADRIALYVPKLFEGYAFHGSAMLVFGSLLYTMQLYCDFAGYSALAIGIARIYGIELTLNFDAPYLSDRISVFWRRWHRSLSQFLRDYIYIPLGGNRKGLLRQCCSTVCVFILCGMWHGSGLNFVVWGALHAVYSVADILLRRRASGDGSAWRRLFGRIVTFCAVSFAWIFFGAGSLSRALGYIARMFTAGRAGTTFAAEMARIDMTLTERNFLLFCILAVFLMDLCSWLQKKPFPEAVQRWPYGLRYFLCALAVVLILLFGVYGPGFDASAFMYMAF